MQIASKTVTLAFALSIAGFTTPMAMGYGSATQQTAAQTVTIDGKVSSASDTSVIVVDASKAEKTITIDTNTKITKGGKPATAADLKANDKVVVVAIKGDGDALTAVTIKVG